MALNSVGTPGRIVGFNWVISLIASPSSNLGTSTSREARCTPKFITTVMPKTWKNGRIAITVSVPLPNGPAQWLTCCTLMPTLAWVSIAPLGVPVVPPVYCSTARSRAGSMVAGAGLPSLAINSDCSTILGRMVEVWILATSWPRAMRNSADFKVGSSEAKEATTARSRQPDANSVSTLPNSTLRSSVTIRLAPLSRTWCSSSGME